MGGSKKGERRGNARKRPGKPRGQQYRIHETPGEIMDEAAKRCGKSTRLLPEVIERRIKVSRIILGVSDAIEDLTPKEVMLLGMRHNMRAVRDLIDLLDHVSRLEPTEETTAQVNWLEAEIERLYGVAGEFAFKAAGYVHPKLQATYDANRGSDANQTSILQQFVDEINEIEQRRPIPIEHKTKTG